MENKNLLKFKKMLSTVSENMVYKNKNFKPKITVSPSAIKFTVSVFEALNNRTKKDLQARYTPVYKKIFESLRQELIDNHAPYKVGFVLKESSVKTNKGTAGGPRSKVEIVYEQIWDVEFIKRADTVATF